MRGLDWLVLVCFVGYVVIYGLWKGRRNRDLDGYILADRRMRWYVVALSIMATQASAVTFLSTPGQAYTDGMRFVQFYLGLPVAMVILSITAVPIYHRLKVYTAYEYLEGRFDLKTRSLASFLFLTQRGLSAGLTIYAPSLIFSVIMGWNLNRVILIIGGLVTLYTAWGGTKTVEHTHFQQALVIACGMLVAFATILYLLPPDISFTEAVTVAGRMGRLNAIDFSFDFQNRYNFWSGLIGGMFVALSYFGTDQSQVQRYLTGESVTQSRLGLLFNGMVKVPMQFFILFIGAMVFVFYQFAPPPVFFNPNETERVAASPRAAEFRALEAAHREATQARSEVVRQLVEAERASDPAAVEAAEAKLRAAQGNVSGVRTQVVRLLQETDARANTNDTNYVFLSFVIRHMPAGILGLIVAAIFFASMSSSSAELNSLASTTVIDIYRRLLRREASERHYVFASKLATLFWGAFAVLFAESASNLGSLVEAVNILGSLFYGTILGIFLLAFYFRRVGGTAVFAAALVGEAAVFYCFRFTSISFLWYNVVGCLSVICVALAMQFLLSLKKR